MVAESKVTFLPMLHVGCFMASSNVTCFNSSFFLPRKGPPEAVKIRLCTAFLSCPKRDWNMALCSLSTGIIFISFRRAASMTSFPPATSVSLLANAISLPASMAAIAGSSPAIPVTATRTVSISSRATTFARAFSPQKMSALPSYISLNRFPASSSVITMALG